MMAYEPVDIVESLEREVARLDSSSAKTHFSEGQSYGHHVSARMVRAWRSALVAELERLAAMSEGLGPCDDEYTDLGLAIKLVRGES